MVVAKAMKALLGAALGTTLAATVVAEDLRMGVASEPSSIDPHFANLDPNLQVARHIFDHLMTFDRRLELKAGLATSWKPINDTTWEFKLRPGVTWHDGSPFTADDVVFTFQRVPQVPNSPSPFTSLLVGKKIAKVDDLTLRIITDKPYPLVPNDLARVLIVSRKHGENAATADYNSGKAAVGTGPYRFIEWLAGDRIVLQANPAYWGGKPRWDRVLIKPIKSAPTRVAALLNR